MNKVLTILFCAVLGLRLGAQNSPAPLRLAVVSESADALPAADLLTAEFSKNDSVQLLERTEIEKVIREQQLSLNNLDCLKLGHLLGADGLLTLQSVAAGTNLFLSVQLVAVRPGVLLADERFGQPAQDASAWSATVLNRLEPLLPKLGVLPQDAIPLSCFDTGGTGVEVCLGQPDRRRIYAASPRSEDAGKPLWELPAGLSLPNLSAALWQSDLFLMADHSGKQDLVGEERGNRPDGTLEIDQVITGEKFLPKDGYDSALFCFSHGLPAALKIRLKFEAADGCPPMAGLGENSQPLIPMLGITTGWMLFTPKLLLCGRERTGDAPGGSEPPGFKPGIWVLPLDSIMPEVASLKHTQSDAVFKQQLKADQLAKEAQAKDQQARQAFLQKYDLNHNGVIDPDEADAAMDDPYYLRYRLDELRAKRRQAQSPPPASP